MPLSDLLIPWNDLWLVDRVIQWASIWTSVKIHLVETVKDHQGNFNIGAKCNFFCYDGFELEGMWFDLTHYP